ncbi:MAG: GTPase HflX [Sporocytophaga sp.]|uniref:GTPase HflX n=1 Tax=Sporocytophaga sp. TaxID=2231183 RepID=UPI001B150AF6|nr:GTPase HflX [Sporocytophaga sp.]MBO9701955.1 GTPase HflX [Sporocytophaga sp.]
MKTNTGNETKKAVETAILVALIHKRQPQDRAKEYLEELAFLASTAGVETLAWFTQKVDHPDRRTFIGKGKLEEIQAYVTAHSVSRVIFDDDLSPSQLKNLENELKVRIYDRSLLILEIFMNRAQTAQARTQVELARYQYLLPRLTRMWTHLERQRGGTGTRGGSGEKEIETDKRVIRDQITLLKEKLKKIDMQNATQRKSRTDIVRVALVGYTNVGKSTLMNLLSKSDVFAENKLFATVDATVRKINYLNIPYLLSDTVGFIRKLPTTLIESFKSTLDEVREADILIHVVDISHPSFEEHIEVVNATLADIKAADKPVILVFNKIDQYHPEVEQSELEGEKTSEAEVIKASLEHLKASYLNKNQFATVFISATQRENIDELREIIGKKVKEKHLMIYPNYLIY